MEHQYMTVKNGDVLRDSVSGLELLVVNSSEKHFNAITVDGRNLDLVLSKKEKHNNRAVFTAKRD